jgi:hypothetical protein
MQSNDNFVQYMPVGLIDGLSHQIVHLIFLVSVKAPSPATVLYGKMHCS